MQEWIIEHYAFWRMFHILSFVSWMAGLFYLPRLFVYHAYEEVGTKTSETFKVMERRLFKAIMHPAMISTVITGGVMIFGNLALLDMRWIHVKLIAVAAMLGVHVVLGRHLKAFANDANTKPHVYFRVMNEVPTVLLIIITVMAIMQPF